MFLAIAFVFDKTTTKSTTNLYWFVNILFRLINKFFNFNYSFLLNNKLIIIFLILNIISVFSFLFNNDLLIIFLNSSISLCLHSALLFSFLLISFLNLKRFLISFLSNSKLSSFLDTFQILSSQNLSFLVLLLVVIC